MDAFTLSLLSSSLIGPFAGAAAYISFTTAPHYRNPKYSTAFNLEQWRSQIDRAAAMQGGLAALSAAASFTAAAMAPADTPRTLLLASGSLMAGIFAYTLAQIIPINSQLKVEKDMEEARRKLVLWEKRHFKRTVMSVGALASASAAVYLLRSA